MNEPARTMCIATAIDPRFRGLKTFSSQVSLQDHWKVQVLPWKQDPE